MVERGEIQPYLDFVRPHYDGRDVGHDFRHIIRIVERLDELAEGINPTPSSRSLNFLSAFHGLGTKITQSNDFRESVISFLLGVGWELSEIDAAFASLATHLTDPKTPEEMMVHDANFFEVTGPFGIAKAFAVGGALGQTYEQTLAIFKANIDKVTFRTPAGRETYEPRKKYAQLFILALQADLTTRPTGELDLFLI